MSYCVKCGHELIEKENGIDGMVPYCPNCQEFRFPMFNSAVSALVLNPKKDKILLIQQYGHKDNILIAGYVTKGENAKQALFREIKEETGLTISSYEFNDNEYYARTNTYINNYIVVVEDESFHCNEEVDYAKWYELKDAMNIIKPDSLAQELLRRYLYKREHNLVFTRLRIKDDGEGINKKDIKHIFERFYKIDKSRSYDVKGAGLGLYLVKSIVELHGGQIVCKSKLNEYTQFVFWLPNV